MWYKSSSTISPSTIDLTSSKIYVYIRKNIEETIIEDEEGTTTTLYVYDEMKIPKEVYGIFEQTITEDQRISDIEDVLTEIIGGEV